MQQISKSLGLSAIEKSQMKGIQNTTKTPINKESDGFAGVKFGKQLGKGTSGITQFSVIGGIIFWKN